ncbi:MAG: hypothetical protein H0U67_03395, partial [Gemmatimonadetes bacterium]|nr:hypothetical protein [Gemmatimonadota bacterium]
LAEGRVVESGTHDDLVDAGGVYAGLWQVQTGSSRWAVAAPEERQNGPGLG